MTPDKPAAFVIEWARACVDAGADIVTASGPHMMRGIEIYNGKPIFYSLGNLWFEFETVDLLPADSYEMWDLDSQALTPADLYDAALLGFHHWALRRHARQLHRCLEQRGALLLVEPGTEAQERAACTALLRYASGGVQTHEIARLQES